MTQLSIVVPVHNVEDYLAQCLDSLLEGAAAGFEVVAIDDASTDSSGAILDAYATRDDRLSVVHLDENRGLGGARNVGIGVASGRYVWFLDSDDWVAPGAVGRVIGSLVRHDPDVLLVGHARVFDRRVERGDMDHVLDSLPPTFRAADHPEVFDLYPSAWTKIVRREVLLRNELDFPTGAYEDLPVTMPLLCIAERIAVRAEVCLFYRQRSGSIIYTAGPHHLDVIDQYELVWRRLDRLTSEDALRAAVYAVMIRHLFRMPALGRIRDEDLATFVQRAATVARRWRPPVRSRTTADRARAWLVRSGVRALIRGIQSVWSAARGAAQTGSRARRWLRSARQRLPAALRSGGLRRLFLRGYYVLQRRRRVDARLTMYIAYWGDQVLVCNPGAIYRRARELAPHARGVWAVVREIEPSVPAGVEYVVVGTRRYYRLLATAGVVISNTSLHDEFVKRAGTRFVQTQHGTPLKAMGIESRDLTVAESTGVLRRASTWDVVISSNPHSSSVWRRAFPVDARLLEIGYPRNDCLVRADAEAVARARMAAGVDRDTYTVLYAPTFREQPGDRSLLDPRRLADGLGAGHSVLVRMHHFDARSGVAAQSPGVVDVSGLSAEEAMLAADALVTDYSSLMFDFAILDRPIALFAPDWDDYCDRRGAYLDLEASRPGVLTRELEQLVEAFESGAVDDEDSRRRRRVFKDRFCPWDDGEAADRLVHSVLCEGIR